MFPVKIKLNLIDSWDLGISSEQIDRILNSKRFVFHVLTFLWHLLLNYQTLAGAFYILFNRTDLVNKTCGFGIQYITIWNQVIEQTYFNASLLQDILEFTPPTKYTKIKSHLKVALPYAFSSLVFPLSTLVTFNFWAIYSYYPRVIDEDNVTESFFPSWVNHGLHTIILLLTCTEKFIVYRSYPAKFWSFLGLTSVLMLYCITCTILYFIGGVWPYPLIKMMSRWQRIIYIYGNIILGYFILSLGEALNNKIWGNKSNWIAKGSTKKLS